MPRVKVIDINSGEKGSIDSKDFDPSMFKLDQNVAQKFASSNILPYIFAAAGGLGGGMVGAAGGPAAAATVPAGAGVGAGIGWGAGKTVNENLKRIVGVEPQSASEFVNKTPTEISTTAGLAGALASLYQLGSTITNPGGAREWAIKNYLSPEKRNVSRDVLQERMLEVPGKYVNPETQQTSREMISQLQSKMFPYQGSTLRTSPMQSTPDITQPKSIDLNQLYKTLGQFEKDYRGYESKTPTGQAAGDISRSIRGLANEQGGPVVSGLNSYMSKLYGLGNIKNILARIAAYGLGYKVFNKLYGAAEGK